MSYLPPTKASGYRPADVERDRTIDALRDSYVDGRLDDAELQRRTDYALRATTYGELVQLTRDVPGGLTPARAVTVSSTQAAISLGLGIGGWLGLNVLAWIPAIVLGHMSSRDSRRAGQPRSSMATTGLVLGYLGMTMMVLLGVLITVLFLLGIWAGNELPDQP